jgi:thiol-disulfide isomerase/thioredoxin
LFLAAAIAALSAAGCNRSQPANETAAAPAPAETAGVPGKGVDRSHAGDKMPDTQLFNAEEAKATLAQVKGAPVLVNLWASWCAPCVKELPTLDALSARPGAPKIVIVSEDIGERPSVDAFLKGHGIGRLRSWRDPKMALSSTLHVQVMPTTVYYDAAGREIWRYTGDLDWTSDEAAKLLAQGDSSGRG